MYRCEFCNSTAVETKVWVNMNEPFIKRSDISFPVDAEDTYCTNCHESRIVFWKEEDETQVR